MKGVLTKPSKLYFAQLHTAYEVFKEIPECETILRQVGTNAENKSKYF